MSKQGNPFPSRKRVGLSCPIRKLSCVVSIHKVSSSSCQDQRCSQSLLRPPREDPLRRPLQPHPLPGLLTAAPQESSANCHSDDCRTRHRCKRSELGSLPTPASRRSCWVWAPVRVTTGRQVCMSPGTETPVITQAPQSHQHGRHQAAGASQ